LRFTSPEIVNNGFVSYTSDYWSLAMVILMVFNISKEKKVEYLIKDDVFKY